MTSFARLFFGVLLAGALFAAPPAGAQSQGELVYLQDRIARLEAQIASMQGGGAALAPQGEAQLNLRIQQLEERVRVLTGQVEEANFKVNELREQVRRFQEDVEFRFRELQGGDMTALLRDPVPMSEAELRGGTPVPGPEPRVLGQLVQGAEQNPAEQPAPGQPALVQPDAPVGAPLDLSALARDPNAVISLDPNPQPSAEPGLSLSTGALIPPADLATPSFEGSGALPTEVQSDALPPLGAGESTAGAGAAGEVVAALPTGPTDAFEAARELYLARDYAGATDAFGAFIDANPGDPRVGEAKFWIGEGFAARGQHREAAEAFLDIYTEHGDSEKAPESLVRLATSLDAVGEHEAACTTIDEFRDKFPAAREELRQKAAAEAKRLEC
jgi:tol-pal system protein YbgF